MLRKSLRLNLEQLASGTYFITTYHKKCDPVWGHGRLPPPPPPPSERHSEQQRRGLGQIWPRPIWLCRTTDKPPHHPPLKEAEGYNRWDGGGGEGGLCCMTKTVLTRGSQRDVVYLGWPIAPSYMSPNVGGGVAGSLLLNKFISLRAAPTYVFSQPMSTAVHIEPK